MTIHDRIKERRIAMELSMETLAYRCGYKSWQTVQQWENGSSAPKRSKLPKVAQVLGVSEEWLATGKETERKEDEAQTPGSYPVLAQKESLELILLSPQEMAMIKTYREADTVGRDWINAVITAVAKRKKPNVNEKGDVA